MSRALKKMSDAAAPAPAEAPSTPAPPDADADMTDAPFRGPGARCSEEEVDEATGSDYEPSTG